MCGIVGILDLNGRGRVSEEVLLRMIGIIRHRGPDESGIYVDNHIGLGHARLSIIGLKGGAQPIENEDGTLWIIYNGEAFNYIELKEDLIKRGHRFSTQTDTEVILHLYEEYGPDCLKQLNGQFAIAIWDSLKKELFLARDRMGIRPLYYTVANNKVIFASEMKAIFFDPDARREIDPESLDQVFTFWSTLTPRTIFRDVYELSPGHYMTIRNGRIEKKAFWSIPLYPSGEKWAGTFEEAEEELRQLLKDAVRVRLRSDVPVGAYLSGGFDSSLITSLIAKHFNNHLRSFSISFEERSFDETGYQNEMVNSVGTKHSRTLVTNSLIRDNFPDVIWHTETPLLRTGPVPLFLLSNLVRENQFKVVLTGEGADEVFGGYNIFKETKVRDFMSRVPGSKIRPLLIQKLYPYIFKNSARSRFLLEKFFSVKDNGTEDPLFSHQVRWNNSGKNTSLFSNHLQGCLSRYQALDEALSRIPPHFSTLDVFTRAQFLEMDIFLSNYLLSSQGDRVAMAHSLEIRLPFLDYRVIDFAARLPSNWKMRGLKEKYILKHAFNGDVPEVIKRRQKQPYRAPIREVFFSGQDRSYVDEMLSEQCLRHYGYFNPQKVNLLISKLKKGDLAISSEVQNMALAGILSTQLLHYQFIEKYPPEKVTLVSPDKVIRKSSSQEK